jgi:hypothetical protein
MCAGCHLQPAPLPAREVDLFSMLVRFSRYVLRRLRA